MAKYGIDQFKITILEVIVNGTDAFFIEREQYWMDQQDSSLSLNLIRAGHTPDNKGRTVSDETKALLAKNQPNRMAVRVSETEFNPPVITDYVSTNAAAK